MKTRLKQTICAPATREEAETFMTELANSVNDQRAAIADRDAEILRINEKYELRLYDLTEVVRLKTDALRAWADANPCEFPKGRKSLQMTSGTLGFRTGTPKLKLLPRWTWEKVLEAVQTLAFSFVRTKHEVDKEAIVNFVNAGPEPLAEMDQKILKRIGVKLTQDETFFIEPNLTDTDARQVIEAPNKS